MAGRKKIECFEYSMEGKYLTKYNSIAEVRKKYFPLDKGKRPLFYKCDVLKTKENTFIANYRIGRDNLLKHLAIDNSNFCNNSSSLDAPIEIYSLKKEKIGEIKNVYILSELMKLNFSRGKIAALMNTKHKKLYPKHGIILKNKSK